MLNLKNFTVMKKIFTLAIIALASISMVACCGQADKKACDKEQPAVVECDKNCAECDKKAECEKKAECPQAAATCEQKSECPKATVKAECAKEIGCKKTCPQATQKLEAAPAQK